MSEFTEYYDVNDYELNTDSKVGVLLIHGFSGTTFEVLELAHFLADQGFRVVAKNLPGHGTSLDDCNKSHYSDWIDFVKAETGELLSSCDRVYCIGMSMGGVLALHLASFMPINGVIAAASVFLFRNEFLTRYANTLFCQFIPSIDKKSQFPKSARKGRYYGYNRYPTIALNQMRRLVNMVRLSLHKISSPTLLIHSTNDKTSLMKNLDYLEDTIDSRVLSTLVVEKGCHALFDSGPDQEQIFNRCVEFLRQ